MALWRIYPVAAAEDSRWQGRQRWEEVIVRASSPAFARIVASRLEGQTPRFSLGNESHSHRSGLVDDKLYWVRRLSDGQAAGYESVGPPDVLAARLHGQPEADAAAFAGQPAEDEGQSITT